MNRKRKGGEGIEMLTGERAADDADDPMNIMLMQSIFCFCFLLAVSAAHTQDWQTHISLLIAMQLHLFSVSA